ncbi:unnamed protein product [Rotaria sp. Silwood2]|nr:unnamed protein product [Rotaria sp. Silwood2]CAF4716608.1 unnamed protein product [Rotaria sp. Silwood2]
MKHGNIKPICLPSGTVPQPADNISMIAVGWGTRSMSSMIPSSILQQITVKSVPSTYSGWQKFVSDSRLQFCAGIITGGKDTCQGDSGGPLMAFVNKAWQPHGITSNGNGCALSSNPGIYTRVSYYIKWIASIVSSNEITTTTIISIMRSTANMTTAKRNNNKNYDLHEQT